MGEWMWTLEAVPAASNNCMRARACVITSDIDARLISTPLWPYLLGIWGVDSLPVRRLDGFVNVFGSFRLDEHRGGLRVGV